MPWPSGVQCQMGSYRIKLLGGSGELPTLRTTLSMISISLNSSMQNTLSTTQKQFQWHLFNLTCKQFTVFIALGSHDGESITHQEIIQCFSGWRRVQIATLTSLWDSVSNGSGLPGCGLGLEPDRMVQSGRLRGKQGYPPGSGTGWNRTTVSYYGSFNFGSN
jgi:hypothetical protein